MSVPAEGNAETVTESTLKDYKVVLVLIIFIFLKQEGALY
jgi:hypothetical protein